MVPRGWELAYISRASSYPCPYRDMNRMMLAIGHSYVIESNIINIKIMKPVLHMSTGHKILCVVLVGTVDG